MVLMVLWFLLAVSMADEPKTERTLAIVVDAHPPPSEKEHDEANILGLALEERAEKVTVFRSTEETPKEHMRAALAALAGSGPYDRVILIWVGASDASEPYLGVSAQELQASIRELGREQTVILGITTEAFLSGWTVDEKVTLMAITSENAAPHDILRYFLSVLQEEAGPLTERALTERLIRVAEREKKVLTVTPKHESEEETERIYFTRVQVREIKADDMPPLVPPK